MMAGALMPMRAMAADKCTTHTFFGLDPWYAGLDCNGDEISDENFKSNKLSDTVLTIAGTIVKDLLFVAGFAAVLLIIYGGFLIITSQGSPGGLEKGKKTITNSVIGLVIVAVSYGIITLLFKLLGNG